MGVLNKLEVVCGLLWFIIGILIIIWLLIPSEDLLTIMWWCFAIGCILTGIWLVADPFLRRKKE